VKSATYTASTPELEAAAAIDAALIVRPQSPAKMSEEPQIWQPTAHDSHKAAPVFCIMGLRKLQLIMARMKRLKKTSRDLRLPEFFDQAQEAAQRYIQTPQTLRRHEHHGRRRGLRNGALRHHGFIQKQAATAAESGQP